MIETLALAAEEQHALHVARAQIERGDTPPQKVTASLVAIIDRLLGGPGVAVNLGKPRPYAMTRDQFAAALQRAPIADIILRSLDEVQDELAADCPECGFGRPRHDADCVTGNPWSQS